MSRKSKFSQEMKLEVVMQYIEGKASAPDLAMMYGCSYQIIATWVTLYQNQGGEAFLETTKNQSYSAEFKRLVVEEYLRGKISLQLLAVKHNIRSKTVILKWISLYNGHKKLKSSGTRGGIDVTNGRKTTYEERIEIVEDCLKNGQDYTATSEKYKVSYQQVYSWVQKFNSRGVAALKDNRGRGKALEDMNELESLVAENKLLKAKLERLEIEVELKKKVQEFRMRLESTTRRKK
ncbi:MAG TPA: transposase [Clostridiaceae bacterium]